MFNSHSLLHSGSLCALSKAELRKKKGVRKHQILRGSQVNQLPAIHKCRSGKTRASCSIPISRQEQGHCSSGQNLSPSSQRSPGAEHWSHKSRQRRPTTTVLWGHIVSPTHTTGTQAPPNLNTTGCTWSHKHTHHGNKTVTVAVIGTPHTPIPTATLHGDTATTTN